MQAAAFARAHRRPFVVWRHKLADRDAESLAHLDLSELFWGGPGLLGVFAEGALAMLLKNIQFTKALVNGGTSFADGAPPELLAERQAWYRMKERSCPPSRGTSRSTACHRSSPP